MFLEGEILGKEREIMISTYVVLCVGFLFRRVDRGMIEQSVQHFFDRLQRLMVSIIPAHGVAYLFLLGHQSIFRVGDLGAGDDTTDLFDDSFAALGIEFHQLALDLIGLLLETYIAVMSYLFYLVQRFLLSRSG